MSVFEQATELYRVGRQVIELSRDLAVLHDELRWAREDLEDVLLDLKLAVMDADRDSVLRYLTEATAILGSIQKMLKELQGDD